MQNITPFVALNKPEKKLNVKEQFGENNDKQFQHFFANYNVQLRQLKITNGK